MWEYIHSAFPMDSCIESAIEKEILLTLLSTSIMILDMRGIVIQNTSNLFWNQILVNLETMEFKVSS